MTKTSLEAVVRDFPSSLEDELREVSDTSVLNELFSKVWEVLRSSNLYAGQPRNSISTRSLALARLALSAAFRSRHRRLIGEAHRMMAYALNANEQYQDSIGHYEESIAALESEGEFQLAARTRLGLTAALFMSGRYPEAIDAAQIADNWFIENRDEDGHAKLSANLGNLYHRLDQHSRAVEYQKAAITTFRKLKNKPAVAQCHLNLGATLSMLDGFEEADRAYRFSARLSRSLGLEELYVQARYNRVYLSFLRGKYSQAIAGFDELRMHFTRTGSERHIALCDLDESEIYLQLNLPLKSLVLARRAAELCRKLGLRYEMAKAITFTGLALVQDRQFAEALDAFGNARRIFEREQNGYWAASVDLYRAQVHLLMNLPGDAKRLAISATERFEELHAPSKVAMGLVLMTRSALAMSEYGEARTHASEIVELIDHNSIPLHLFPCYSVCGEVAEKTGEPEQALEFYRLAAEEAAVQRKGLDRDELRVAFSTDKQAVYESLVTLSLSRPDSVIAAYEWCESAKSRALVDLLSNHLSSIRPPAAKPLLERIERLDEQLNSYSIRSDSAPPSAFSEANASNLKGKKDALALDLSQLSGSHPEYASLRSVSIVGPNVLRRSLPKRSALVEYFVIGDEVIAFTLSENRIDVRRDLVSLKEIEELREWLNFQMEAVKADSQCGNGCAASLLETTNHYLRELYSRLVAPLLKNLAADHLVIIPHGVMHYLPFHAFHDGERYLMDRYSISYAPSASVFHYCMTKTEVDGEPLLMGVADDVAPFIEREIHEVQKIAPRSRVFTGPDATRKVFQAEATSASFVHIATHSVFQQEQPMSSSFKLADGLVSALDLYSMSCEVDLITLSGCRSGMSEVTGTDEVLGLVRGFLYTGARSLLLSLWDLDDQTTSAFMSIFYREWLEGNSKAQALRSAATAIRSSKPHPFFWAPFYLVGKP
jgi:CHAT domain-containing protein/tetratricopeptide (TPR) repeat protein